MVRENPDPYLVLGVSPTATQAEIAHAYRTRLRAHHPDTRPTPPPQTADEHLRQLLAAYALLRDPARRADTPPAHAATPPPHRPQEPTPADSPGRPRPDPHHLPNTNTAAADVSAPPLRAGPVRRHR